MSPNRTVWSGKSSAPYLHCPFGIFMLRCHVIMFTLTGGQHCPFCRGLFRFNNSMETTGEREQEREKKRKKANLKQWKNVLWTTRQLFLNIYEEKIMRFIRLFGAKMSFSSGPARLIKVGCEKIEKRVEGNKEQRWSKWTVKVKIKLILFIRSDVIIRAEI